VNSPSIPFLDLITPHRQLKDELAKVFDRALETAGFVGGSMVADFEQEFSRFCGTRHCVGVGSGTDAVRFALIAAGVKPGDVVLTVPNTFIATTEGISQAGATPDFVDVDERTYNMDPQQLLKYLQVQCSVDGTTGRVYNRRLGKPVTAVVPVHLYGQPADMDSIAEIADRFGLLVVEDACQAHGAEYYSRKEKVWKQAGAIGRAAAFSFYPGKNLGACGEAGAVTTNDDEIARHVRMLRDHGQSRKYYHDMEGYNGRLDAIQAGILHVKLTHLGEWNENRRQAAVRYRELFNAANGSEFPPCEPDWSKPVYHLYVIRVRDRDSLLRRLAEENIGAGIHYPVPLHLQKAYDSFGYKSGDFPVTEKVASEIVSLPMFPNLSAEQQTRVVRAILRFISESCEQTVLSASSRTA